MPADQDYSIMPDSKPSTSRARVRRRPRQALVKPAAVEREKRKLRAIRDDLKERPTAEDTDIRDTLL